MRLPKPRIHIVDSQVPLNSLKDLTARCSAIIKNGELKFAFTEESPRIYQIGTCRKCIIGIPPNPGKRYEYGIVEGEENRAAQNEETL